MRLSALFIALALAFPHVLPAQSLPALFDVTGVATNDILNVREAPDTQSAILAGLGPDAKGVEVVSIEGNWGLVAVGDVSGWAHMRYLRHSTGLEDTSMLNCSGTEPFWSFAVELDNVATLHMQDTKTTFTLASLQQAAGTRGSFRLAGQSDTGQAHGVLRREMCADGMSERSYGLSLGLITTGTQTHVLDGCCTLATR